MLYVLGFLLSALGMFFANFGSSLSILLIPGIFLLVMAFIRDNNKQKDERSQFLMMSKEDAERYINNTKNPRLRIKLINDWRNHHISTKL